MAITKYYNDNGGKMADCCRKVMSKNKVVIRPENDVKKDVYVEGVDGFVKVKYISESPVTLVGKKTKNKYLFVSGSIRSIDKNDVDGFFDRFPGEFELVVLEPEKKAPKKTTTRKKKEVAIESISDKSEDKSK